MMGKLGRLPTPAQQLISDVAGEVLPSGRMAYPIVVVIMPRRAGKTALTVGTNLQRATIAPDLRCWYTAQTGGDAATTLRDQWAPLIESSSLAGRVKIRKSNGSAGLWLPNGSRFSLFAPTESALHGQDGDVVTVDESWAFDVIAGGKLEAAVRPVMATRRLRQLWIESAGGTEDSTWLLEWRAMGRLLDGQADQGIAYFEWYPPGAFNAAGEYVITADLDDPETWRATHPALGSHLDLSVLIEDHKSMKAGGKLNMFYRSYLNVFTDTDEDDLIPAPAVRAAFTADPLEPGPGMFIGYAAAPDLEAGSVVLARMSAGRLLAEIVDQRPGTAWMAGRIAELRARWQAMPVADSRGPATSVTRALRDLGVTALELDTPEYLDACSELLDDLRHGRLGLRDQDAWTTAAKGVARSEVGDAWKFSQKRSRAEISPWVALAVAGVKARHATTRAPFIHTG